MAHLEAEPSFLATPASGALRWTREPDDSKEIYSYFVVLEAVLYVILYGSFLTLGRRTQRVYTLRPQQVLCDTLESSALQDERRSFRQENKPFPHSLFIYNIS